MWNELKKCHQKTGKATIVDTVNLSAHFVKEQLKHHPMRLPEEVRHEARIQTEELIRKRTEVIQKGTIRIYTMGGRKWMDNISTTR